MPLLPPPSLRAFLFLLTSPFAAVAADPALTIYNQGFAVVRDSLHLDLQPGLNHASFSGATAQVEPDSVILRDPAGQAQFQILEQNYRNDPVSEKMLLSLFEGKVIEFVREEANKPDQIIKGKVIRSGFVPAHSGPQSFGQPQPSPAESEPIVETNAKLQFTLPGRPIFPSLGDDTILQPTLSWTVNSPAAAQFEAEIAYVTQGLTWFASYNIVAPEKGDLIDLVGWVTMQNDSGTAFTKAKIKLMAGNVNKVQPVEGMQIPQTRGVSDAAASAPVVTEKAFDEYHLYTLANPATLRDKETKQVEFVRASGVQATRLYIYEGLDLPNRQTGAYVNADPSYGLQSAKTVAVYRSFKNSEANHLGLPLPKGRVRFYSQDADRQLEFVGENEIDHTPKDELIRLFVGNSFDLVGERKRIDFKVNNANHRASESLEITLKNHKTEVVEIRVVEHLDRWQNWEIVKKSQSFEKTDSETIEFAVPLKPDEEKTVTYQVRYTW